MREEKTITVDLTATSNRRSKSPEVEVPAWATRARAYVEAGRGWGTGTPAVVEILHKPTGGGKWLSFASPATVNGADGFVDLEPALSPVLRAEVTTAGVTGDIDTEAAVTFVFTDVPF